MATYQKRGTKWRATVRKKGVSESATFATKGEAVAWAQRLEADIEAGKAGRAPAWMTFGELLTRYAAEVSPTKKGERWEQVRITALVTGHADAFPPTFPDPIAAVRLADLDERHFAAWRDRRLRCVSPASVRREWSILSGACTVAVNEWRLLDKHPIGRVVRPKSSAPRARLPTDDEIERLLHCCGYALDQPPVTATARVGAAILFAIESAMRAGEIVGLRWQDVELDRRFCRTQGKTPAARRDVPLSTEAVRILVQLRDAEPSCTKDLNQSVFHIAGASLDALYRKMRKKAGIEDLHFHDFRHAAITQLSRSLDVLALARAVGHRDLKMLMVYYNPSAEDLAKRLK